MKIKMMMDEWLAKTSSLALIVAVVFLAACESKWDKMPDDELAAKSADCFNMNSPGAAMAKACENYERECQKRRDKGIYIC
jgi:hypothetical protein